MNTESQAAVVTQVLTIGPGGRIEQATLNAIGNLTSQEASETVADLVAAVARFDHVTGEPLK